MNRNIVNYQVQYVKQPYEHIQVKFRKKKVIEVISRYNHQTILEVGCGLESIFRDIDSFDKIVVVEPSEMFYQKAKADKAEKKGKQIILMKGLLEDVKDRLSDYDFDFIILSGLLHEVVDPKKMLESILELCSDKTVLHINVPNAKSFHRLLAVEMGLITDEFQKSANNIQLQQNTIFDIGLLKSMVTECGYSVIECGSYAFKPFAHAQMQRMLDDGLLTTQILEGFYKMEKYVPDLGSEIFVNVRKRGNV